MKEITMKSRIARLCNEIKSIKTIDLALKSTSIPEKFFWIALALVGIGWATYFIEDQGKK